MSIQTRISAFYNSHPVFFAITCVVAALISCIYPIAKDCYVHIFDPKVILFEELNVLSICDESMDFYNNFLIEQNVSPTNIHYFHYNEKLFPTANDLMSNSHSEGEMTIYDFTTISKWVIKNCSDMAINKDMVNEKIKVSCKNCKIIDVKIKSKSNCEVGYSHDYDFAVIDFSLINPHEKIIVNIIYAPINNKESYSLCWDCHIENITNKVNALKRSVFFTPRISLKTNQIIQLIVVAFLLCVLHSLLLNSKGFFTPSISLCKIIMLSLSVLFHFSFAECIAYLNLNYIEDSPEGYNWPWIGITAFLELISFILPLTIHFNNENKLNTNLLNLSLSICKFCQDTHSVQEIMNHLQIKSQNGFSNNVIQPLLNQEIIECVPPDSFQAKQQKFRLTKKGQSFLKGNNYE